MFELRPRKKKSLLDRSRNLLHRLGIAEEIPSREARDQAWEGEG